MGNSSTKEQRAAIVRSQPSHAGQTSSQTGPGSDVPSTPPVLDRNDSHPLYEVRTGRGSRPDLSSFLGIRSGPTPEVPTLETRRASKQEREARKLEVERVAREKERERSMREEHVDGGYLVTQGVYTGTEDYNKTVVRNLMIERRVAPFWKGLNEHSASWTENQLVAAARGKPIPAPDAIPEEEPKAISVGRSETGTSDMSFNNLTVPITSRSQSVNSDTSSNMSPSQFSFPQADNTMSPPASTGGSALFRGRSKTLAALTTSSKNSQADILPREMQLPRDSFFSGQQIEAYLYKDASECPICFLYYPPYLNKTRCCDQAICSECFVQIKRPDPHAPEHADPTAPPPVPAEPGVDPEEFISEPAACPFCVQPEFGITYDPPPFRRGLTYVNHLSTHPLGNTPSAMSSATSLSSAMSGRRSPIGSGRRRTISLSANSPTVITTDRVRPDWHQKLATARAHTARRSAAATALHTAAYLMGNRQDPDGRALGAFGRRGILRRTSGADAAPGANITQLNMLAMMSERYAAVNQIRGEESDPTMVPGPRLSSRRGRADDLEDMMMMEAIRLSLASEEERRKRDDKDAKKDAKKKEKESKKADKAAEKAAKKAGVYPSSAKQSSVGIDNNEDEQSISHGNGPLCSDKGKAIQPGNAGQMDAASPNASLHPLTTNPPQEHLKRARAHLSPNDPASTPAYSASPYRPSHLRTLSNVSSSASSLEESNAGSLKGGNHGRSSSYDVSPNSSGINIHSSASAQDTYISGTPPGGGANVEPMFNFRSLAAMVGDDEKAKDTQHEEHATVSDHEGSTKGESSADTSAKQGSESQREMPITLQDEIHL